MKLCKDDLLANIFNSIEMIHDIHCQSKDMVDFLNLQGRLESRSLKPDDEIKHIPPRKPCRNQAFLSECGQSLFFQLRRFGPIVTAYSEKSFMRFSL